MNIVKENIGHLVEHVTVELEPADYQEAVAKTLKDLKKKANIPGFRAGHVPMGMIERQYKSSVMLDEVSKLVNDRLEQYLKENNIRVLFEPLAVPEKTKADFEKEGNFSFTFEIGIRPEVKPDFSKAKDVPYLKITASEGQIDEEEGKLRRRLGKFSSTEEVKDGDMALVHVAAGDGIEPISSSLPTSYFKESYRNLFVGKKLHESFEVDTKEMFVSDYERATLLKRKPTELEDAPVNVTVSIDAVHHVEPAELDAEFFSRAFPDGMVTDESGMRERLKEQIERNYESQEKIQYRGAAMEALMSGEEIGLPDTFVKRYLTERDSANYTKDNIEERYPDLQKSICFQLMENAIATEGNVEITRDDILDYLHEYLAFNYFGLNYKLLSDEQRQSLESLSSSMLKEDKTVNNIYDNLYFLRITDVIFEKSGGKRKNVTWDEFLSGSDSVSAPKKGKGRKQAEKTDEPDESKETKETKTKRTTVRKTAAKKE